MQSIVWIPAHNLDDLHEPHSPSLFSPDARQMDLPSDVMLERH
jgi:hypothetical protein